MRRRGSAFMLTLLLSSLFAFSMNTQPVRTQPITIIVPDEYLTIQEAIDAASSGDTVFVRNGTYIENVFINKSLSLVGESKEATIIDGNGTGNVVTGDYEVDNVTICGFTLQNSNRTRGRGISIESSNYYWAISGNIIKDCGGGIRLHRPSINNVISGNLIADNIFGISAGRIAINLSIIDNVFIYNSVGIAISEGSENLVSNNTMLHGEYAIVTIHSWGDEVFTNNNIINCTYGFSLHDSMYDPTECEIYHNNLIDVETSVLEGWEINLWDNGYPSGGNYWSNHNASDMFSGPYQNESGSDGIADTPYYQDQYPLMAPINYSPWDVTLDGYVGIEDIVLVAEHFASYPGHPRWNPLCDINIDGYIGIDDIVSVAEHFGESI
ncbi:MAG: right-handed parallel beta-helix repeat-containing protein [Candidatus Bathyarchaeota archaeon]|nr:MAG: right-handed parallel beta-helix repeat-containing protein [Candidatus Bathyarchaeota archaeon]